VWAAESVAYGVALQNETAGYVGQFTVQTKDVYGNNITIQTPITFEISFVAVNNTPSKNHTFSYGATYKSAGAWMVYYNQTLSGSFFMHLFINQSEVGGSPYFIPITPGTLHNFFQNFIFSKLFSLFFVYE
jgi:hypothetical protein